MTKTKSLFSLDFLKSNNFIISEQSISKIIDSVYDLCSELIR